MKQVVGCPLCRKGGEEEIVRTSLYRIVLAKEEGVPPYFRLIWNEHVKEMSDLATEHRNLIWNVLNQLEKIVREELSPDKINLAQFGNVVPHLHWHLIARFKDDPYFPDSVWGIKKRVLAPDVQRLREAQTKKCISRIKDFFS